MGSSDCGDREKWLRAGVRKTFDLVGKMATKMIYASEDETSLRNPELNA